MENKKKLLIAGGGHSDIPLIKAGKELGFYVITTGNNKDAMGHKYSDEYHYGDFSNKEEMLELAKNLKIDAICACSNDFSAITASYVAEKMGLSGHDSYETTLLLHHKDRYRKFAMKHSVATPYAESFTDEESALAAIKKYKDKYPLIVKPIDLTGGKGVAKIEKEEEYEGYVKNAFKISRAKRIVIEEFFEGTQHSFSTFIREGKVVFSFSDNEYSYKNQYLVSTSAAPATGIEKVKANIIKEIEKVSKLLLLKDGLLHLQYLMNGDNFIIIEITRRCPGDLYGYPVEYQTGLDYGYWIVRAETGMGIEGLTDKVKKGYFGRHCIMGDKNGRVKDILIDKELENNIIDRIMFWKENDPVENYMICKFGILFLKYDTEEEMIEKTIILNDFIRTIIE